MKWFKRLFLGAFVLLFVGLDWPGAWAIEYGGIGGRPAYPREDNPRTESIFVHTLEPGAIQDEGVLVLNNSDSQKIILVYATDSTPSTGGAFACEQLADEKDDVGAWINLTQTEVTLEAHGKEILPFTITVPQNASVGEHNGCIVMQEKKDKRAEGGGIQLSFRTGLRVAVLVPGDITRQLEIVGMTMQKSDQNDSIRFSPRVKNLGNVSVDADVEVKIRYWFGVLLAEKGGQYPILRGDTSSWNFDINRPFWGGWYKSTLTVSYDAHEEAGVGVVSGKGLTYLTGPTITFYSPPTTQGLLAEIALLLIIVILVALLILKLKRRRWIKHAWIEYEVKSGEDIKSLASRFNVSWKLLAKANNLKPPYSLTPGSKIKVPPVK